MGGEILYDPEGLSGWAADALMAARSVHRR